MEPELTVDSTATPLIPSCAVPKRKRIGRKPKNGTIPKPVDVTNGNNKSMDTNSLPVQTEDTGNGDVESACSTPESELISTPVISISGRVASARRSGRERRPRQIDDSWIY